MDPAAPARASPRKPVASAELDLGARRGAHGQAQTLTPTAHVAAGQQAGAAQAMRELDAHRVRGTDRTSSPYTGTIYVPNLPVMAVRSARDALIREMAAAVEAEDEQSSLQLEGAALVVGRAAPRAAARGRFPQVLSCTAPCRAPSFFARAARGVITQVRAASPTPTRAAFDGGHTRAAHTAARAPPPPRFCTAPRRRAPYDRSGDDAEHVTRGHGCRHHRSGTASASWRHVLR